MNLRYIYLHRSPEMFQRATGLHVPEFDALVRDLLPAYLEAARRRLDRPSRQRAIGAGHPSLLEPRDQFLLAVIWLRQHPTHAALGEVFGVSDSAALRAIALVVPLLEAAGRDVMRVPDPGRKRHHTMSDLLVQVVAIDGGKKGHKVLPPCSTTGDT